MRSGRDDRSPAWRLRPMLFAMVLAVAAGVEADESMDKALEAYQAGDFQQSLEIWLLKAYDADAEAQYRLGQMFADGTGTVADLSEAVYWYTRAAEQSHPAAQFELGNAWFHGTGTPPDKTKALEWWRVAAQNGHAPAQYVLGRAYFYGIDVEQDSRQAVEWFARAADGGNALALSFLERIGVDGTNGAGGEKQWDGYARVGSRTIRVYSSFNRLSPILTLLEPGSLVRVVGQRADWFRVQIPGGIPVWVPSDSIEEAAEGFRLTGVGVQAWPDPQPGPGTESLGMLLEGDRIIPTEYKGDWVRIRAPETISAWLEAIDIEEINGTDARVAEQWQQAREASLVATGIEGRSTMVVAAPVDEPGLQNRVIDDEVAIASLSEASSRDAVSEGVALELTEPSSPANSGVAAPHDDSVTQDLIEGADGAERAAAADGSDAQAANASAPGGYPAIEISSDFFSVPASDAGFGVGDYLRVGPAGQSIYARDRLSSARIDRLPAGLLLRVEEQRDGWVSVQIPGGLPLWIYSRFIDHDGEVGRITGEGVRARPLPSTSSNSQPVGVYPEGASVRVVSVSDPWVRIRAPEELSAWMQVSGLFLVPEVALEEIAAQWQWQGEQEVLSRKMQSTPVTSESESIAVDGEEGLSASHQFREESSAIAAEPAVEVEQAQASGTERDDDDASSVTTVTSGMRDEIPSSTVSVEPVQPENGGLLQSVEAVDARTRQDPEPGVREDEEVAMVMRDDTPGEEGLEFPGGLPTDAGPTELDAPQQAPVADGERADEVAAVAIALQADEIAVVDDGSDSAAGAVSGEVLSETGVTGLEVPGGASAEVSGDLHADAAQAGLSADPAAEVGETVTDVNPAALDETSVQVNRDSVSSLLDPDSVRSLDDAMVGQPRHEITERVESAPDEPRFEPAPREQPSLAGDIEESEPVTPVAAVSADSDPGVQAQAGGLAREVGAAITLEPASPRFDDLAWLYRQSAEAFSIEVMRGVGRETVMQAARLIADLEPLSFSSREQGHLVYNLMVGAYPDLLDVKQALGSLQSRFDSIRIRRLGAVQQEWCNQIDNLTPEQLLLVLEKCGG